ncbi:hypothetical protein [Chitinophaga rhizophila]|uniref:Uncharacterized protein n=1 Tax=Chitinophaga rhizophila TaxID=2866212 RepID=A0ABS7GAM4_9BACT|nr:hypothetical protein [Chitinophaga rhizophila]MBW8684712.1 hypothetical protein [Chitinophaga rhizophila]
MKFSVLRGIIFVATLLLSSVPFAQKPGGVRNTATPVLLPPSYTNTNINYVSAWEPDMPLSDTGAVISTIRKVREVKQTTQYLDSLG